MSIDVVDIFNRYTGIFDNKFNTSGYLDHQHEVGHVVCVARNCTSHIFCVECVAPRARDSSRLSITNKPAPSPMTKPSRALSHGRLAPSGSLLFCDKALQATKPPKPTGIIGASDTPAIIISASPPFLCGWLRHDRHSWPLHKQLKYCNLDP